MSQPILTTAITGTNLVALRDRTRQVGDLFGLDKLQCTRFITAVSEIVRNTVQYAGGGSLTFVFEAASATGRGRQLVAQVADKGPGIDDLRAILAGRLNAKGQVPLGIVGSKRLVDNLSIEPAPGGGTVVTIAMSLPRGARQLVPADVAALAAQLAGHRTHTPLEEVEGLNRDMVSRLDQLRQRQVELLAADERKNQFLATLAHELRNPLGTLQMTLDMIGRKPDMGPDELSRRCAVMLRQTHQLTRLVDDLMDVSRITHGKVDFDKQPAEVNELVSQAVEMSSAAIQAKAHEVAVRLHDEQLWINADPTRMMQVLCNLLQNAARYTPDKGMIAISVRREAAYAVVEVEDNGIGIAPEVLPGVFGMFVQGGEPHSTGSRAGLGVGLTLVQRLTEDHGGTVSAASAGLGQGSRFTVALPLSSSPEMAAPQAQ
jgi:signal transduction histidine kinase